MWSFHLKSFLIVTRRTLAEETLSNFKPSNFTGAYGGGYLLKHVRIFLAILNCSFKLGDSIEIFETLVVHDF